MELASWRRIHSASGLFPLAAYLVFHAWEHWPVRRGRDALFARLTHTQNTALELLLVIVPLLAHASLGLWLARHPDREHSYASPAFRRLQGATGALSGAFIVFHLSGAWRARLTEPNQIGAAYSAMLDQVGALPGLVFYLVGLAAVCTHLGQGAGAALLRLSSRRVRPERARAAGIAFGILLWLTLLNELASYASYEPLL